MRLVQHRHSFLSQCLDSRNVYALPHILQPHFSLQYFFRYRKTHVYGGAPPFDPPDETDVSWFEATGSFNPLILILLTLPPLPQ